MSYISDFLVRLADILFELWPLEKQLIYQVYKKSEHSDEP